MQRYTEKNQFIIFWIASIAILAGVIVLIVPFIPAILWATVFTILVYPIFEKLIKRGWKRGNAAITVTLIPALVLILPLVVMGSIAGVQIVSSAQKLINSSQSPNGPDQDILLVLGNELDKAVQPILKKVGAPEIDLSEVLERNQDQLAQRISGPLVSGFQNFVLTIVTLVISLLTMFFMVRDCHNMKDAVLDLVPLKREHTEQILEQIANTVRSVFFAVVIVAGIQGVIALITYWISGIDGAIPLALITTLLCTIPLLGAPIIYVPLGLFLIIEGNIWQGIMVLGVGFLIISQIDNLLRPLFIGARTKLHEIPVFFSLLGGVIALGPIGLMAGPMLLTLILAIIDILRLRKEQTATMDEIEGDLNDPTESPKPA
jgi:predicted PurR-regulated permease PerM